MPLLSWAVLAITFLIASVQGQNSAVSAASAAAASASADVNVANVPDCAKVCLSNSTQYATDCAQIDVHCLCSSPSYVSALSCCLATNCSAADQQTAIQFNIQECAAVNSTAPNFVGCSPFSLTTGGSNAKTTTTAAPSSNVGQTTISGDLANVPVAFTNTKIGTASFSGGPLLTGSCTVPLFAQITDSAGNTQEFPQVGCTLDRGSCCPFDPNEYAGLTKCPADYATTSGACCPNGYSVYYTALGAETPCFSKPTITYMPATTPSGTQVALITDTVFSRRYVLVSPPKKTLPAGGIAGITVNAVLFVCIPFVLLYFIRRHKRKKAKKATEKERESTVATFPPVEPTLQPQMSEAPANPVLSPTTHELASPEISSAHTPATLKGMPFPSLTSNPPSSPPAYEVPGNATPHEMPGSTYLHEHHPAFTGSLTELSREPPSAPRTPPRSPDATASTRSPVLSPSSPFRADSPSNATGITITPLGSPRPLHSSTNTRFREGTL